ncbi:MAG: acetoin utilization protein AcuC [Deltaproteobacteria bacterium]|nr:acetoin utilization protein AcuC [Deltaproteobacteria bacterium]
MNSVFLYTPKFEQFEFSEHHPFKPYRAKMVYELCYRYGLFDYPWVSVLDPEPEDASEMLRFHSREYVEALRGANKGYFDVSMLNHGLGSSDNPVFKGVLDFSLLVLGATLTGADRIASGQADIAFNPIGGLHHAGPDFAEGFCYVNDIVIAIKRLFEQGLERILYVDIDAHHGNGVQDAFYDTDQVMFVSFHQSGDTIYPGTGFENEMGTGKGLGYTVNVPLPEYTDDDAYIRAFKTVYPPVVRAYNPQIVIAQVGLDTLKKDPLTNLRCTNNSFQEVISEIKQSNSKVLALGGGGYSVKDVAKGWTLAWAILNDIEPHDPYQGLIGGAMYGFETSSEELYDPPHRISENLKKEVDRFVDQKLAFIEKNVFPYLGIT